MRSTCATRPSLPHCIPSHAPRVGRDESAPSLSSRRDKKHRNACSYLVKPSGPYIAVFWKIKLPRNPKTIFLGKPVNPLLWPGARQDKSGPAQGPSSLATQTPTPLVRSPNRKLLNLSKRLQYNTFKRLVKVSRLLKTLRAGPARLSGVLLD